MTALDLSSYSPTRPKIEKVRYTHDAMIDLIVADPSLSQGKIAATFGYTESWISTVFASDAFQSRLALRKEELVDPKIRATVEERFKALVLQSMEVLQKKLEKTDVSDELALGVLSTAGKALGYGARNTGGVQVNAQFVVHVPAKMESSVEWETEQAKRSLPVAERVAD